MWPSLKGLQRIAWDSMRVRRLRNEGSQERHSLAWRWKWGAPHWASTSGRDDVKREPLAGVGHVQDTLPSRFWCVCGEGTHHSACPELSVEWGPVWGTRACMGVTLPLGAEQVQRSGPGKVPRAGQCCLTPWDLWFTPTSLWAGQLQRS